MANDENKIILEFPATNAEIEFGETITFDNISGFLNSDRVTYNGESLTEEISRLDGKIDNLPEPMIFKGTLGVGGTIQSLPTASASNEGYTYKVITDGTYAGQTAKDGDVFTSNGSAWVLIPSGDEDNDTWRAIKFNGVEKLGNGISSGAVDFEDTTNVKFEFDANGNKVRAKLDGIYTESEVDDLLEDKADADNTYTKEQVDDIIYGILPDDTASGSVANFTTSLELPIKSLEVDVNAVQDLHGYDYPWVAGGGKNLININGIVNTETKNPAEVVTLANGMVIKGIARNGYLRPNNVTTTIDGDSITVTSTNDVYGVGYVFACKEGQDYCFSSATANTRNACAFYGSNGVFISGSGINTGTQVYTAPENVVYGIIIVYPSSNNTPTLCTKPQLEVGSTVTSYAPYENICPISGRSEVSLVYCGKNLYQYDESKVKTGTTTTSTIRAYYPLGFKGVSPLTFTTALKSGSSISASDYLNIGKLRKSDGLIEILSQLITPDGITTRTLSISSDDDVVLVSLENPTVIKSILNRYDIQIEVGSSASSFEPYTGTEVTVQFGQTIYKGILDAKNSKVIATHLQLVLTADNTNIIGRVNANKYRVLNSNCGAKISGSDYADILCDILKSQTGTTNDGRCYINASGDIRMNFVSEYNSVADMIADVGSITLVYPLATPIEIPLSAISQFTTLNGTNNIYADTGDCAVEYKCSVAEYVANHSGGSGAKSLGGVFLGGSNSGSEEEPTEESEEPKEEPTEVTKTLGDEPISKK